MKLPSIHYLLAKTQESFLRFPATLVCALVSVCATIYLIEYDGYIKNSNIILTSALGIPLFFGLSIFNSSQNFNLTKNIFSHALCATLLVIIHYSLPDADTTQNTSIPYIRYGIFNVIIHLLVSFSPYLKGHKINGFWNFNKILFVRFWTSILYSVCLYGGLILVISLLKLLFDVDINNKLYLECLIVIMGLFNTWFFISGIPSSLENLEHINEYPNGLKIFAQYILLPLLFIYLIIFYLYGAKIIISWDWPKGILSYLISCVSILGILTMLLLYPYGYLKNNSWIKKFTRMFYFSLIPLVIFLFIAIGIRIEDYGITINRYAVVVLGIWLTLVVFYFSFAKKNIKLIPMSLVLFLGLVSFGPWSIFEVSEKSQINRLTSILENNNLLQNGKIVNEVLWETDSLPRLFYSKSTNTNVNILNDSLHKEVKSIIKYLDKHHGFSGISKFYMQNIDSLIVLSLDRNKRGNESLVYMRSMGLYYNRSNHVYKNSKLYKFRIPYYNNKVIPTTSYDYLLDFDLSHLYSDTGVDTTKFDIEGTNYILELNMNEPNMLLLIKKNDSLKIDLNQTLIELISRYGLKSTSGLNQSEMKIEKQTKSFELKLLLSSILFTTPNDSTIIKRVGGKVLFRMRE